MAVWQPASSSKKGVPITSQINRSVDLPALPTYRLSPTIPAVGRQSFCLLRPSIVQTIFRWYRNMNRLSITYAFRPRLRSRLTLGGLTFPRNPWAYGERFSHPFSRYSYRHTHFHKVQQSLQSAFSPYGTLLYYYPPKADNPQFRLQAYSHVFSAQDRLTSELLRTL